MLVRALAIVAAMVTGFVVAFGGTFLYLRPTWDRSDCGDSECLGDYVLSVWFATVLSLGVAIGAGVVAWLLLRGRAKPRAEGDYVRSNER